MSKSGDPKPRYVAVKITGPTLSRKAFSSSLTGHARKADFGAPEPRLTRYEFPYAIVRCDHFQLAKLRELLPTISWAIEAAAKHEITITTLRSSGTIKTLTKALGILAERGPGKDKGDAGKPSKQGNNRGAKGPGPQAPKAPPRKAPGPSKRPTNAPPAAPPTSRPPGASPPRGPPGRRNA